MNKLLFLVAGLFVSSVYSQETIKVSVYMGSLSPDTRVFVHKQLYPAYRKLAPYVKIDMVPYGIGYHTHIDGVWNFQCLYGYRECYGNRVMACALAQGYDQDTLMAWFNCVFSYVLPVSYLNTCAKEIGLSWTDLNYCSQESEQGYELSAKLGDRTHAVVPEITYIPTIIFNNKFDQKLQDAAEKDFLDTICNLFTIKPIGCLEK